MNRDAAVRPAMTADGFDGDGAEEDLAAHRPNLATDDAPPNVYLPNASLAIDAFVPDHDPVLGVSVMEKANAVSEVEIGPGIYLGHLSLDDYKFVITSLVVMKEEN